MILANRRDFLKGGATLAAASAIPATGVASGAAPHAAASAQAPDILRRPDRVSARFGTPATLSFQYYGNA